MKTRTKASLTSPWSSQSCLMMRTAGNWELYDKMINTCLVSVQCCLKMFAPNSNNNKILYTCGPMNSVTCAIIQPPLTPRSLLALVLCRPCWTIVLKVHDAVLSLQCFTSLLVKYPKVFNLQVPVACDSQAG